MNSKKICPENKILNPVTNKCVLKTGRIGKKILKDTNSFTHTKNTLISNGKKICPENKILNNVTNKCVLKTGRIGKKLLKDINSTTSRSTIRSRSRRRSRSKDKKICPENKILNPVTHKCVLKSGKIGKNILNVPTQTVVSKPVAKYINGPFTLSKHHSDKYNKTIYIFGEAHGNNLQCSEVFKDSQSSVDITDYLHTLFSNTDVFIDFYLEDPLPEDYKLNPKHTFSFGKTISIMTYLRQGFINCLDPKKRRNCPYSKNMRAHFVDIREETKINPNPTFIIDKFIVDFMKLIKDETARNINRMYDKYNTLINDLKNIKSRDELSDMFVTFLKSIPILKKEIKRSELKKKKVYKMARTLYYNKHSKTHLNAIQKYINPEDDRRESNILSLLWIHNIFFIFKSLAVDTYTLVRTFKTFRKTEFDIPDKPSNIIYYLGDAHSENLREYLSMLGFDTLASSETQMKNGNYVRCLEMGQFKQPFFT